jgi:hypothetical protein
VSEQVDELVGTPELVEGQSAPVAPPSGANEPEPEVDPAQPPPPRPSRPEIRVETTGVVPDSRPVYLATPAPAAPDVRAPQAVDTGDLERSTESWEGENAALSLVAGVDGHAIRVSRVTTGESFAFYARKTLRTQRAGAPYRVRAVVRSVSPGMFVCLRAEEHTSGPTFTTERCVPATSKWQRVKLLGRAAGKGTKVSFSVHVMTALGGKSFDVDAFRLS